MVLIDDWWVLHVPTLFGEIMEKLVLDKKDLAASLGIGDGAVNSLMKDETFPKPFVLNKAKGATAQLLWLKEDIVAWLKDLAQRNQRVRKA